jgi:hypothetical protein
MGIGPPGTRPGDQVWVLCGGQVPFVVRKTNRDDFADADSCERALIGDAYVHGVMDGEAVGEDREMRTITFH